LRCSWQQRHRRQERGSLPRPDPDDPDDADHADNADDPNHADNADDPNHADNADNADHADNADEADGAARDDDVLHDGGLDTRDAFDCDDADHVGKCRAFRHVDACGGREQHTDRRCRRRPGRQEGAAEAAREAEAARQADAARQA
jgi:hypothetical protein